MIIDSGLQGLWALHAYYTTSPWDPSGSGRYLLAATDENSDESFVVLMDRAGRELERFGHSPFVEASFFHTGRWQTWSPDGAYVFYTAGSLAEPFVVRRHLVSGAETSISGDMEGAPSGYVEPVSGLLGMLHATGAGDGTYDATKAPVDVWNRAEHGLFRYDFEGQRRELVVSVADLLDSHPERDKLSRLDRSVAAELGGGLSLMAYCVRWAPGARRLLFHFGNHSANVGRGEPRVGYVMTANADLSEPTVVYNMSGARRGVHWSWQPDGRRLIGYGEHPTHEGRRCLAEIDADDLRYSLLSDHASGGHPSVNPADPDMIVTDEPTTHGGAVVFLDRGSGAERDRFEFARFLGSADSLARSRLKVDHHPVFSSDGSRVMANAMRGTTSTVMTIEVPA